MNFQNIGFRMEGRLSVLTLDDKNSANALSNEVIADLATAMEFCEYDEGIGAILIEGANDTFCSGGDIRALKEQADNNAFSRLPLGRLGDAAIRLKNMSKPTICAIQGACAGAGVSLAMTCDFSIAKENAKFTFAFVNLALVPDMGATALLVKSTGVNKAKELLLGGGVFSGKEAADWGIVTKAVPEAEWLAEVEATCKKMLAAPHAAYARIKTMINRCTFPGYDAELCNEAEYQYASYRSADHVEGINAFIEKRQPRFQGN